MFRSRCEHDTSITFSVTDFSYVIKKTNGINIANQVWVGHINGCRLSVRLFLKQDGSHSDLKNDVKFKV